MQHTGVTYLPLFVPEPASAGRYSQDDDSVPMRAQKL